MHARLAGADIIAGSGRLTGLALCIAGGRIAGIEPDDPRAPGRQVLPPGCVLAPGFIDVQVNGGGGIQFNDAPTAAAAHGIAAAHRRLGSTAVLPTLITDTPDRMRAAAAVRAETAKGVLGLHFEGPFISPERPGVHQRALIRRPDPDDLMFLEGLPDRVGGPVVITLAPEIMPRGAVARLRAAGLRVCAGHSAAAMGDIPEIDGYTHVFNAMGLLSARAPGVIAAALMDDVAWCGVIADGHHVDPALLRLLLRCKPPERIMLVSDAMAVAGTDLTDFVLQGRVIRREGGRLLAGDGTLAGADLSVADAVRFMVHLGVDLPQAVAMASANPAAFLGVAHERGEIALGRRADLVLLGPALKVLGTWVGGVWEAA